MAWKMNSLRSFPQTCQRITSLEQNNERKERKKKQKEGINSSSSKQVREMKQISIKTFKHAEKDGIE